MNYELSPTAPAQWSEGLPPLISVRKDEKALTSSEARESEARPTDNLKQNPKVYKLWGSLHLSGVSFIFPFYMRGGACAVRAQNIPIASAHSHYPQAQHYFLPDDNPSLYSSVSNLQISVPQLPCSDTPA